MRTKIRMAFVAAAAAGLAATSVVPALATPGDPRSATYGPGDTVRARLYEHENLTGERLTMMGTTLCTEETYDIETTWRDMRDHGWNDEVSSARDYNLCDINMFEDIGLNGSATGLKNYTTDGRALPSGWSDRVSSFLLT